ncbi:LPXTG cell wall anchor domain-containing protein, partial [Macrococcus epidermidis]
VSESTSGSVSESTSGSVSESTSGSVSESTSGSVSESTSGSVSESTSESVSSSNSETSTGSENIKPSDNEIPLEGVLPTYVLDDVDNIKTPTEGVLPTNQSDTIKDDNIKNLVTLPDTGEHNAGLIPGVAALLVGLGLIKKKRKDPKEND